jgi:hypothetical protein
VIRHLAVALLIAAVPAAAQAQQAPASPGPIVAPSPAPSPSGASDPCGSILSIVTRPTVTTSTCTVRDGHALLETGYTNTTITGNGGGNAVTYPQALLRIGIAQHADLEITPPSFDRTTAGTALATGWSDTGIGAKWELGYTQQAVWGVNVQATFPTGSPPLFTAGHTQYTANANWGYTLNSVFALAGTVGLNWLAAANNNGSTQNYFAFIPTLNLTAGLPNSQQLGVEYAYFSHAGPGLPSKGLVDFEYQRDFGPHQQLDLEYGFQPNVINGQKLHYVGAGLSFMY